MPHPLETEFELSSDEILNVIDRSPRCKQMVKGFVGEYHLEKVLNKLKADGILQAVERIDADGQPDFRIRSSARTFLVECKLAMTAKPTSLGDIKVDFQRTRNSPADPLSRFYKRGNFDILAACLYNQTKRWEFRYIRTADIPVDRKVGKDCLIKNLRYPGGLPWYDSLIPLVTK